MGDADEGRGVMAERWKKRERREEESGRGVLTEEGVMLRESECV